MIVFRTHSYGKQTFYFELERFTYLKVHVTDWFSGVIIKKLEGKNSVSEQAVEIPAKIAYRHVFDKIFYGHKE